MCSWICIRIGCCVGPVATYKYKVLHPFVFQLVNSCCAYLRYTLIALHTVPIAWQHTHTHTHISPICSSALCVCVCDFEISWRLRHASQDENTSTQKHFVCQSNCLHTELVVDSISKATILLLPFCSTPPPLLRLCRPRLMRRTLHSRQNEVWLMQRNFSNCIRVDIVAHPASLLRALSLFSPSLAICLLYELLLREKVKHGCPAGAPVEPLKNARALSLSEEAYLT